MPAGPGTVTAISAGLHACAVSSVAIAACWGYNGFGETTVPALLGTVTAIGTGDYHSCAITTVGTAACWGGGSGEGTVPGGLGTVSAISLGGSHSCAVRTDGIAACWGRNFDGESTPPVGLGTVTAISAGDFHTCAVRTDGTAACWGRSNFGQTTVPAGLGTVSAISAGALHTCAVKTDGTVACWGYNVYGQATVPAGLGTVTAISLGFYHSCAVKTDGTVACWGSNFYGEQAAAPAAPAPSPPAGTVGTAYTHTFNSSGVPTATLSVSGGSLPVGLTLSPAGVLSGTPTSAGSSTFTLRASNGGIGASATTQFTLVIRAAPTIATSASANTVLGSGALTDSATVSGRVNPVAGATITFRLYGPDDATCAAPVFSPAPVNYPVAGGPVTSPAFTPTQAGTYRWVAGYSGDANNAPVSGACNDANETTVVTQATPTLTTMASPDIALGAGQLTDSAAVSGRINPVAGATITFRLYGPDDATCAAPVFSPAPVNYPVAGGAVTSPAFTPTQAGTYRWIAAYSGDANNAPVSGACNAANETVVVSRATPTTHHHRIPRHRPRRREPHRRRDRQRPHQPGRRRHDRLRALRTE